MSPYCCYSFRLLTSKQITTTAITRIAPTTLPTMIGAMDVVLKPPSELVVMLVGTTFVELQDVKTITGPILLINLSLV